ncbi:MAG: hypothetical protein B1H04_04485 [Planctomycetales bacterium 4484_123]|nr:MAG: hypothetical protein B1H04_04485 [Planctomycetales bacterium 4484_123]
MRNLAPEEIRQAVRGRWRWPARPVSVEGVSADTRTARPGDLFVALRGRNFDGHDFLAEAASAGCVAAVVDQAVELPESVLSRFEGGVIGVADTTAALGDLAAHCRSHLATSVVAVTGSNGKTTVKAMIHHILSRRLKGRAAPRSFNNAVGVPLTIFSVAPDDDYVVCEVGTNALGEVAALARIVKPNVAVVTSVAKVHLEGLIDLEHVAREKASLLTGLAPGGMAVVTADSPELGRALRAYEVNLVRFGRDDSAELRLTGYEARPGGGRFELNGRAWFELSVPGSHNALNALAAIAVAQRFGFDQDEAASALVGFTGLEMRLQPVQAGPVLIIDDTYNANPASLAAAVDVLVAYPAQRRVLVLGDMLELGPASADMHRDCGRWLATVGLGLLVGVGKLGQIAAATAAEAGAAEVRQVESVAKACRAVPKTLKAGDVVLVKGSHAMEMQRLVEAIRRAFSPRKAGTRSRRKKARG